MMHIALILCSSFVSDIGLVFIPGRVTGKEGQLDLGGQFASGLVACSV